MNYWLSFFALISAQLMALLLLELEEKKTNAGDRFAHSFGEALASGAISGLVLGLAFDEFVGRNFDFFHYYIRSPLFTAANGALSYGLAIATALRFSPVPLRAESASALRGIGLLVFISGLFLASAIYLSSKLLVACTVGSLLILGGEIFEVLVFRTFGPLLEATTGHFLRPARNWLVVIILGCTYELVNFFFPVWRWWFTGTHAAAWDEFVLIFFGYTVLFHVSRIVGLTCLAMIRGLLQQKQR
jgi:hypothetical protein